MKKIILGVSAAIMLPLSGFAQATLIGDWVNAQHYYPSLDDPIDGWSGSGVVENGSSDTFDMGNIYYDVNVEASSIFIDYGDFEGDWYWGDSTSHGGAVEFNGLVMDSLNDSTGNDLFAVSIDTNMGGWDDSFLTFDADTIWFNWTGLTFNDDSYFTAILDFGESSHSVPEPATLALMGIGLVGLGFGRRKAKNK